MEMEKGKEKKGWEDHSKNAGSETVFSCNRNNWCLQRSGYMMKIEELTLFWHHKEQISFVYILQKKFFFLVLDLMLSLWKFFSFLDTTSSKKDERLESGREAQERYQRSLDGHGK